LAFAEWIEQDAGLFREPARNLESADQHSDELKLTVSESGMFVTASVVTDSEAVRAVYSMTSSARAAKFFGTRFRLAT